MRLLVFTRSLLSVFSMVITGTHFNYYQLCHRKLWLFANGINMEQESDLVYEGKLVHESSYPQRTSKYEEVEIDGIKVDYYDAKNKVIHEIKKSNKVDKAHEWQLKYYMYVFEQHGIDSVKGILEYPLLRKTQKLNKCLLNEKGKKIFVKAMEERYDETFRHRSLGRNVSYKHLIKLECYKLLKDILGIEEYKPFKMYW